MKIAILAPITWRTPPRQYGPWEQVCSVLMEGLVKRGIDATLFATGDSLTKGRLEWICEKPLGEHPSEFKVWESLHISHMMEQAHHYDVIHNHFDFLPLGWSKLIQTPMITTIHGFSSPSIVPVYKKYNANTHYVSISNTDRQPSLTYLDTVYNGVDETQFDFGKGEDGYLLYFGRIHPHKGAFEAIQIASRSGNRLVLCGLVQDEVYFEQKVRPWLNDKNIVYLGNVGPVQRNKLMGDAKALLHPISFEEPFGLSVTEAMLCGTPVIAFNRGSMPELIVHEKTGFLVGSVEEAISAVESISSIRRQDCRDHAMEKFSSQPMVEHYIRLYRMVCGEELTAHSGTLGMVGK